MRCRRGSFLALGIAGTLAGCSSAAAGSLPDGKLLAAASRGAPLALAGPTVTGGNADIGAWRGEVVVLNAWGSWCGPCKTEAPTLAGLANTFARQHVRFLGLDERDSPGPARDFDARYAIPYPSIDDATGRVVAGVTSLPVDAVPTTLVLDRAGRPAGRIIGAVSATTLSAMITSLLTEAAPRVHP